LPNSLRNSFPPMNDIFKLFNIKKTGIESIKLFINLLNFMLYLYYIRMIKNTNRHPLFLPLLAIGIVITIFAIFMIFLGRSIEQGEGFEIIGTRFILAGIATIGIGFFAQYYDKIRKSLAICKYLLKNISKTNKFYK
jgi:Family of unknown function (DUF6095)